jgi:hypothetical protein
VIHDPKIGDFVERTYNGKKLNMHQKGKVMRILDTEIHVEVAHFGKTKIVAFSRATGADVQGSHIARYKIRRGQARMDVIRLNQIYVTKLTWLQQGIASPVASGSVLSISSEIGSYADYEALLKQIVEQAKVRDLSPLYTALLDG